MALDNATLAQLLGGGNGGAGNGSVAPPWANGAGIMGNYLMQQGQPRPAAAPGMQPQLGGQRPVMPMQPPTAAIPQMGAGVPQMPGGMPSAAGGSPGALGGAPGASGGAAGGMDPLVLALLRAKLSQGMSGGGGMGGTGGGLSF